MLVLSGDITIAQDLHDHKIGLDGQPIVSSAYLGSRQELAFRTRKFFKNVTSEFPHVVYVAGNHEFYGGKWYASIDHLREEASAFENLHFLENDSVKINEVTFVGGTLWTNMNKGDPLTLHAVTDMMSDFKYIRNEKLGYSKLRPALTMDRHRRTLGYIKTVVDNVRERENLAERVVVVGHHSPSFLSCHPQYKDDFLLNGAYHSDLSEFILDHPEIALWTHGHTHHCFDYFLGDTRIVCNPRGYASDDLYDCTGWDPHKVVEI